MAEARVVGCEHHLQGTQTGSLGSRAPNRESFRDHRKYSAKDINFISLFSGTVGAKAKIPNILAN